MVMPMRVWSKKSISSNSLRTTNSTSCGCNTSPNLTNKTYGKLLVIKFDHSANGRRYWLCKCNCNNYITASTNKLRNGKINSCGCDQKITRYYQQITVSLLLWKN